MRLTLRTLLAYLDDRLSAEQTRDLGRRISSSSFSGQLIDRIQKVKRSRRTAAADGVAELDPNLIAEYLDDQLEAAQVAEIEKRILGSDRLLAEVAATHEVLGNLRDVAGTGVSLRERLVALDRSGGAPVSAGTEPNVDPKSVVEDSVSPQWEPLPSQSGSGRRTVLVISSLLAAVWVILLLTDSRLLSEAESEVDQLVAQADASPEGEPAAADSVVPDVGEARPEANPPEVVAEEVTQPPVTEVAATEPAVGGDATEMSKPVTTSEAPAISPVERSEYYMQADNQFVLVAVPNKSHWTILRDLPGGDAITDTAGIVDSGKLLLDRWFGIPQFQQMSMRSERDPWLLRIQGEAILRFPLGDQSDLQMVRGRCLFSHVSPGLDESGATTFRLQTGDHTSTLTLAASVARAAIEVIPLAVEPISLVSVPEEQREQDVASPAAADRPLAQPDDHLPLRSDYLVTVTVLSGGVTLKQGEAEAVDLPTGFSHQWRVAAGQDATEVTSQPAAPASLPDWMLRPETVAVPERQRLTDRLAVELSAGTDPLVQSRTLLADKNSDLGVMAAGMFEIAASADQLLEVLFTPAEEMVHRELAGIIRRRMAGSHAQIVAIRESLETRLAIVEVPLVMQLLRGLNLADTKNPETISALIRLLNDERLLMRTLAIAELERLTGDRLNYFPAADAGRRRDAVRRWERLIERQRGELTP